jgi:hypothetical protein
LSRAGLVPYFLRSDGLRLTSTAIAR